MRGWGHSQRMTLIDSFLARNETFRASQFDPNLKMMPKARTIILGCVDPRVDPALVLGLEQAETAVIRNVGGRVTPDILLTFDLLREVSRSFGGDFAQGANIVLLHHTDCGIRRLGNVPDEMGRFFHVAPPELESRHIHDPYRSVNLDVETLRAHASISSQVTVSGLVYDVATGKVDLAVPPATLR